MNQEFFKKALLAEIEQMCEIALSEDLNSPFGSDITAELIPAETNATATLITRENAILCGTQWVNDVFKRLGANVQIKWLAQDGDEIKAGETLCELNGNAREMLTGERAAMNFLQSLSATATITNEYVKLLGKSGCKLLDTRKTIPGMRFGQKYAVACGGGTNHRIGLHDAYLIKENHIMACGGIKEALAKAIQLNPSKKLEIEVETIEELKLAIEGKAQIVMLDNFKIEELKSAKTLINELAPDIKLEASGNVNHTTIVDIAKTGVDYISVGALTKDLKAVDLSLRVDLKS